MEEIDEKGNEEDPFPFRLCFLPAVNTSLIVMVLFRSKGVLQLRVEFLRDHSERVFFAFASKLGLCSVVQDELQEILLGIRIPSSRGLKTFVVESDSHRLPLICLRMFALKFILVWDWFIIFYDSFRLEVVSLGLILLGNAIRLLML